MEVKFKTKEESKKEQLDAFLALSGAERVMLFLRMSKRLKRFPTKYKKDYSKNFVIDFTKK